MKLNKLHVMILVCKVPLEFTTIDLSVIKPVSNETHYLLLEDISAQHHENNPLRESQSSSNHSKIKKMFQFSPWSDYCVIIQQGPGHTVIVYIVMRFRE